jgi:drug/metabolite transporter (DMT)-like permease
MITANLIFACCVFALKLIPADMFDIMAVRFLFQSIVFGTYAAFYKHYDVFNTNGQPVACALNIFMSSGTNLTYFAAFYFLPLSDLNTIKYTYIVWAAMLSVIFLKERFKFVNGMALFLTCIGLMFATKPDFFIKTLTHIFDQSSTTVLNTTTTIITTTIVPAATPSRYYYLGVGLASLSALTKAIQAIARKQLVKKNLPYSVMNFHFTTAGLCVSSTYSTIRRFWQPEPYAWKWMISAGLVFGCCQLIANTFAAKALKRENVQLISIFGSIDIVYAVILQYIFFRQTKSWIFYIGALLIVLSAVIISTDRHMTNKRERKDPIIDDRNHAISNHK